MSKKKDPIVGVMEFFEGAELSAAQSALALAHAIVKRRQPAVEKKTRRARIVRTKPINQATPIVPPAPPAPPTVRELGDPAFTPPAPARRSRARSSVVVIPGAEAALAEKPDLALPGLGPSTIGD